MEQEVFTKHQKLSAFPAVKLSYIIYRRLKEHGIRPIFMWVEDKVLRRIRGVAPQASTQVQPLLYVGGQHRRRGLEQMRSWGITAIVNMREESDDAARGATLEHYLWLPTPDDAAPSPDMLQRGVEFIAAQLAAGHGVYIHCASGVGRAPLMAATYLVSTGMSAEEAWATIRRSRPFIRPTPPQLEALAAFAQKER